jgi:CheY-like chemotaxis protein/HPt (histidine-containing phosphotransfer) domain-containing protein
MIRHRILVVEDEADVRKVVELALARDPELSVRTCASGREGLAEAAAWSPDLVLLDVMMPGMDGPTTLAHLRDNPATAEIPVVFLTARARPAELAHFVSLGARGAIAKPFVPSALRAAIRSHLQGVAGAPEPHGERSRAAPDAPPAAVIPEPLMSEAELRAERVDYLERLQATVARLTILRAALRSDPASPALLDDLRTVAHRTAGSAGLYGFERVSATAARLEDTIIARRAGNPAAGHIDTDIDVLLSVIGQEQAVACG